MIEVNSAKPRFSGVLLHPTSLPGKRTCGGFGQEARDWLELLAKSGISVWQVLPLSPPDSTGSPYSSPSSFAFNPWLLDVNDLAQQGFIAMDVCNELSSSKQDINSSMDFDLANLHSRKLGQALRKEWPIQNSSSHKEFLDWCADQFWLEDHVMFMELRIQNNQLPWWEWPEDLALHNKKELNNFKVNFKEALLEHSLLQWHLDRQWSSIRSLANDLGILIFGDLPFYVSRDSADVWSNRSLFSILANGEMYMQSGVPPDYFSETGQLWGTPVYRWQSNKRSHFRWWRRRLSRQWNQFDLLRLDHFRALDSFWAVPGNDKTAQDGSWIPSPGLKLLKLLKKDYGQKLPLIAEDLGVITPRVEKLRNYFGLPGMKILQFAFDGNQENPYLPENIRDYRSIVYTGTHDNETTTGWWAEVGPEIKSRLRKQSNQENDSPAWQLIELGLQTQACLFIAPMQDILGLGNEARFNTPGTVKRSNWSWRLEAFNDSVLAGVEKYGQLSKSYGRSFAEVSTLIG
ncbi:4-alpha-glucanotransferase [Prochlorococcus marinus]|uniref:4-alpha-glucanotransferase n=1 Tax=Prochlorococcus marinus (strain MIT 9211) TaxID=93059 RepID=A9BB25_PROM4|nr:4-alpha-glucanotransferase [Prochlorococcus marinus]ABX09037.1 4-alpha-glucanotransferase [Prochlorococcus marinus str. MIT 9211]